MRAIKPGMDGTPGKKILKPCTIHYSNVMLIDPSTGLPTKVATRFLEDGSKVRVAKKSGHIIPKPDPLADRKVRSIVVGWMFMMSPLLTTKNIFLTFTSRLETKSVGNTRSALCSSMPNGDIWISACSS